MPRAVKTIRIKGIPVIFANQNIKYNYISGIQRLDYLVGDIDGVERRIYLLYDLHDVRGECPPDLFSTIRADEWIIDILKTNSNFIDVFLETQYMNYDVAKKIIPSKAFRIKADEFDVIQARYNILLPTASDALSSINRELAPCYDLSTNICPYDRVRIHYADPRLYTKIGSYIHGYHSTEDIINFIMESLGSQSHDEQIASPENLIKYFLKVLEESKIVKQWLRGPLSYKWSKMLSIIIHYYYENVFSSNEKVQFFIDNFGISPYQIDGDDLIMYSDGKEVIITNSDLNLFLSYIRIPIMDLYLLGRLIKRFNSVHDPHHAENVIIYVGTAHALMYYNFLIQILGFTLKYRAERYDDHRLCVDISDMPYPLFD